MEIRCEKCGHLGPAAEVRPVAGGVGLICGECGHPNVIAMGSPGAASEAPDSEERATPALEAARPGRQEERSPKGEGDLAVAERAGKPGKKPQDENEALRVLLFERLLPEPGDGLRCRKCASLIAADDENCARCGLNIPEGLRHKRGQEPWEKPPPGREALVEQAWLLWESVEERESAQKMEDFIAFALEEGLVDFGVRRLQHYLVDHREDPVARAGLATLAERMEKTLQVARTQAQAGAETFTGELKRFRTWLLLGTLLVWVVILVLLSVTFWDKF